MRLTAFIAANLGVLLLGLWAGQTAGTGTEFPSRPIRLVVPFSAGGGTDTFARVIDKAVRDHDLLPVPLAIINQGGAGGTIGSRRTKEARPDGYTVMILHQAIFTAKISGMANYGIEAFDPVAATGEMETVLAVPEDSRWKTLSDLLAEAAAKPGEIRFAANMGALSHFVGLQLEQLRDGAEFRFAQFGGGADRLSAILGSHVDLSGFTVEEFLKFQPQGLRALAVFSKERHKAIPDVPTALEQGFDFTDTNTFFWWVPKGTDPDRIQYLADVLQRAMETPFVQQRLASTHFKPLFLRGDDVEAYLRNVDRDFSRVKMPRDDVMPNITWLTFAACVSLGLLAFGGVLIPRAANEGAANSIASSIESDVEPASRNEISPAVGRTIIVVILTFVYVAILSQQWLDFRAATIAYVALTGVVLSAASYRMLPASDPQRDTGGAPLEPRNEPKRPNVILPFTKILLLAQGLGFGLHYVFTQLLVIDLP